MGMIYGTMRELPQVTTARGRRRTCNKPLTVKSKAWIKRTIAKYQRRIGHVELLAQLNELDMLPDVIDPTDGLPLGVGGFINGVFVYDLAYID
jgi:hypothetical protein